MADDTSGADTTLPRERVDVVVVGAGQAGLAAGHYLRRRRALVSDSRSRRVRRRGVATALGLAGSVHLAPVRCPPRAWRSRATRTAIPPATKSFAYLESYAASFELPIEFLSPVSSLVRSEDGFILGVPGGSIIRRTGRRCDRTVPAPVDPSGRT